MRNSILNPIISAYTELEGTFNYNKTSLAPSGYKVVINENTYARRTQAPPGSGGWYIGHALDHYIYHQVYVNTASDERIGYKIKLLPHQTKNAFIYSADRASLAAGDLK